MSKHEPHDPLATRREVLKKMVYVAPAILTLPAIPSFASSGSGYQGHGRGKPPWAPGPPPWARGKGPKEQGPKKKS